MLEMSMFCMYRVVGLEEYLVVLYPRYVSRVDLSCV
jgi:hypothetical protein